MYIEREDQLSIEIDSRETSYIQICSRIVIDHQVYGDLIYKESVYIFLKCLQIKSDIFSVCIVKDSLIQGDSMSTVVLVFVKMSFELSWFKIHNRFGVYVRIL